MRVIKSKSALKLQTVIRLIKGVKVIRVRLTGCKQAAHEAKPPQPNIEHRHILFRGMGWGFKAFMSVGVFFRRLLLTWYRFMLQL